MRWAALAVVLLVWTRTAHAHQASITHSTVQVSQDQASFAYRLQVSPPDLAELLGLVPDAEPTDQDVARGADRVFAYVLARISVRGDGALCPAERDQVRVTQQGGRFVEITWTARCSRPVRQLAIEYDMFFDLDPLHRALINVHYRGQPALAELAAGKNRFVWDLEEPPPSGHTAFVISGIEHIVLGFDHIAFLLGLLLVVVIRRWDSTWQLCGLLVSLRDTAAIVTSFTVAHSITLIAASLGWIRLDSRLVESIIAASIVYVAVEDILKPDVRFRYLITFAFGLVHGLGFASMLEVLLPPGDVVVPLLMFNVGVELGQLAIVVLVMPLLYAVARILGAPVYRSVFLPIGAGVLAVLGATWLIERVFALELLGL